MKVNDIPFSPRYEEKHIAAAKKFFSDRKETFGGTANFGIVLENGRVDPFIRMSCHRGISTPPSPDQRVLVATEHGTTRSQRKNEVTDGFLDWFVNKSYFGRYIVEKDLDYCRTMGFIISADVAAPLLQNICIVTRHFYEVATHAFEEFNELVAGGVDPMIAYPLCFNTTFSHSWTNNDQIVKSTAGHRAHPLFNLRAWQNWMNGDLGAATPLTFTSSTEHYRTSSAYTGGTKFFFDSMGDSYSYDEGKKHFLYQLVSQSQEFRDGLSEYRGDNTVSVYRPPNPFSPKPLGGAARKPEDLTYRELWEFALPWCIRNKVFTERAPDGKKA